MYITMPSFMEALVVKPNRWCKMGSPCLNSQNLSSGFGLLSGGILCISVGSITSYQPHRCKAKCNNVHCARNFAANFATIAAGAKQHPPPHPRREEATAKLLRKVTGNDRLPLCADIIFHPNP